MHASHAQRPSGRLVVVDLESSRVVSDMAGVDRAPGILAVPAQHWGDVSVSHCIVVAVQTKKQLPAIDLATETRLVLCRRCGSVAGRR